MDDSAIKCTWCVVEVSLWALGRYIRLSQCDFNRVEFDQLRNCDLMILCIIVLFTRTCSHSFNISSCDVLTPT